MSAINKKRNIFAFLSVLMLSLFLIPSKEVKADSNIDKKIVDLCSLSINGFYSQEEDSCASVYEESNKNQYIKLAYSTKEFSSFYFDTTDFIYQDGIYKFEADIRYNSDLSTDNVFVSMISKKGAITNTIASSVSELNNVVTPLNNNWNRITSCFSITDYYAKFYDGIKFGFNTMSDSKNFIDIDNIKVYYCPSIKFSETNSDGKNNGDFEKFEDNYQLNAEGWHCNETYFVNENSLENSIVKEGNDKYLKLYTSNKDHTDVTKSINVNVAEEGWYRLKVKAKAGKDFKTDNIGFRMVGFYENDNAITYVGETIFDFSKVTDEKFTYLESKFYMSSHTIPQRIELSLWVFTHNDEHKSADNYLLIDDLAINKQENDADFGINLFEKGEIKDFNSNQGQILHSIDYQTLTNTYPYIKEILPKNTLEQFEVGKKFIDNCKEQGYWGTVSYDVPAEIVDMDGYHAVKLSHDGKQTRKTYSSFSYLLDLVEMSTQKYYVLEFDFKFTNEDTDTATISFIGVENKPDFEIDLLDMKDGFNKTKGYNKNVFNFQIIDKENSWKKCRLIFKPDMEFKERVTALRFLINANYNVNNSLYVSNITLHEHSKTPYPVYKKEDHNNNTGCKGSVTTSSLLVLIGALYIFKKKKGAK